MCIGFLVILLCLCSVPTAAWAAAADQTPPPIRMPVVPASADDTGSAPLPGDAAHSDALSPQSSADITGEYVLGPGDVLVVTDYSAGPDSKGKEMPVLPDGNVNIFPVGVVKAAGLTLKEFNDLVNKKAEQYFVQPQIDIVVKTVRPADIYILGEVANPGIYATHSLSTDTTGFDQTPTVVTALQRAGGLKESADVSNIRVTRLSAKQPLRANLWDILVYGDTKQDIPLQSGDTVFVPRGGANYDSGSLGLAAHQKRSVRVWGSVRNPGLYELKPSDDVLSVIATAGGFSEYANTSSVFLSRLNRNGSVSTEHVSVKKSLRSANTVGRHPIQAGDVIVVAESPVKRVGAAVARAGLVIATGFALIFFSYNTRNINVRPGTTPTGLGIL